MNQLPRVTSLLVFAFDHTRSVRIDCDLFSSEVRTDGCESALLPGPTDLVMTEPIRPGRGAECWPLELSA